MKIRGSKIVVKALVEEGVRFTFGIPGTHNVELYDALDDSMIEPVLVTDEQSASFMADGVSRTSDSIGVVNVVPGAGITHALSGIAEAYMDNIPMLVLACGIRNDTGNAFQLHDIDQKAMLAPVVKKVFCPKNAAEIYPMVRQAVALARSGTPGPVAVEIGAEFYILTQDVDSLNADFPDKSLPAATESQLALACQLLEKAKSPALYVGYGATGAAGDLVRLAESLNMPVCTTVSGKGVFPENHSLWLWNGFGKSAPSFVQKIMDRCDCLLAVGCRFGEVATASYGIDPPKNLIHVDINDSVFDKNFKPRLAVTSDAALFVQSLIKAITPKDRDEALIAQIAKGHEAVGEVREKQKSKDGITPSLFFSALQSHANDDAIYATDSGNGTFLAMEHLRLKHPGCFMAPADFSCMGYSVPAAIGAKLANPNRDVIALPGDGALLMTGLELLTSATLKTPPAVFVLRDRELSQIVQIQRTSFNRDTCAVLGDYDLEALSRAMRCSYLLLDSDQKIDPIVSEAIAKARNKEPVVVEVKIDYSHKTWFTKGVIVTNLLRMPWGERLRMISRAAGRRIKN